MGQIPWRAKYACGGRKYWSVSGIYRWRVNMHYNPGSAMISWRSIILRVSGSVRAAMDKISLDSPAQIFKPVIKSWGHPYVQTESGRDNASIIRVQLRPKQITADMPWDNPCLTRNRAYNTALTIHPHSFTIPHDLAQIQHAAFNVNSPYLNRAIG